MATRKKKTESNEKKRKLLGILLILLAVLIFISLVTHSSRDDRMFVEMSNPFKIDFHNQVGVVGAISAYYFFFFFGWISVFIPLFMAFFALRLLSVSWRTEVRPALLYGFIACTFVTMLINVYKIEINGFTPGVTKASGGFLYFMLTKYLIKLLGKTGSVVLLGVGMIAIIFALGYAYPVLRNRFRLPQRLNLRRIPGTIKNLSLKIWQFAGNVFKREDIGISEEEEYAERPYDALEKYESGQSPATVSERDFDTVEETTSNGKEKKKPAAKKLKITKKSSGIGRATQDYTFPGLNLLADNPESGPAVRPEELNSTAEALRETLKTFNVSIDGSIEKYPGPVITRFEFKPAAGIKVNQIVNLSDDLALSLRAKRIRIVAPIPGKAAIGVEIPNRHIKTVYLKDILNSEAYADSRLSLPLALGKTISGRPFVTDLSRMPHLLVAGATNSGKSVCINAMITSMIYRLHPDDLKFILIDPKMLELSVYSGIPYLGRPVVTHPKRAEKVLSDAVGEMEIRYKKLASAVVRNIDDYNKTRDKAEDRMPYIVIIIDELADMMMAAASSRIEMLITRLAQMARAVGIHLILATQRPSVDVITGLIKSNFPARIAFAVATRIDSKTILDGNGAEKLLGNGDMLFLQPGQPEPIRLHGAFITGEETRGIVAYINEQFPDEKLPGVEKQDESADDESEDIDLSDPLFIEAVQTVIRNKQGSVSLLQRKLGIGYQRACRLIDKLEEAGVVARYAGSKAREVLVDNSFLEKLMASRSLSDSNSE